MNTKSPSRTKRSGSPRASKPPGGEHELLGDGLLTVIAAADWLAISRSAVYQLLNAGEIAYVRIGADRRIPRRALIEYANTRLVQRAAQ